MGLCVTNLLCQVLLAEDLGAGDSRRYCCAEATVDVETLTRNQEVRYLGAGKYERCQGVTAILNQTIGATLGSRGIVAVGEW